MARCPRCRGEAFALAADSPNPKTTYPTMKLIALAIAAAALASCASKPNPAPSAPTGGYVTPAK